MLEVKSQTIIAFKMEIGKFMTEDGRFRINDRGGHCLINSCFLAFLSSSNKHARLLLSHAAVVIWDMRTAILDQTSLSFNLLI